MTHNVLIEALVIVAEAIAAKLWMMQSREGNDFDDAALGPIKVSEPNVYRYKAPPRTADDDPAPFILIRPMSGHDEPDAQNSTARVAILLGAFSQDDQGYREVLWLVEALRYKLATEMLSTAAVGLRASLDWTIYWGEGDQPIPYWQGQVIVEYKVPSAEFHPPEIS